MKCKDQAGALMPVIHGQFRPVFHVKKGGGEGLTMFARLKASSARGQLLGNGFCTANIYHRNFRNF